MRRVLDDGRVLVETNLGMQIISTGIDVSAGNTVEYSTAFGIEGIVSKNPVRLRDVGVDDEDPTTKYRISRGSQGPTFDDFGGYGHVIARARELIETQLGRKARLDKIGARPIKGVMFTGPPGTGKTLLAQIIAQESEADFFLVSGPSIVSKWVGDSEETLRRIFEAASSCSRAIIFFDEIDSLADRRKDDSNESAKRIVAQLLTLLDGFDKSGGNVVVIAATNRIQDIDDALQRPGRFDWEIEFGMPDADDRLAILKVNERKLNTSGELPLSEVANRTDGWSAARLTSLWTEAALLAASDDREAIGDEDFAEAFERVSARPDRARRLEAQNEN